jgi:hypothetical protein
MDTSAHAYLVESIPKGLDDLRGTPGVAYTEDVLVQLTSRAKSTIDLTAMYWVLLADPGSDDEKGFTPEQLDAMGAGAGRALYEALRATAQRGVHIRIFDQRHLYLGSANMDWKSITQVKERKGWTTWGNQAVDQYRPTWKTYAHHSKGDDCRRVEGSRGADGRSSAFTDQKQTARIDRPTS